MRLHVAVLCVAAGWPDCNYFTYTIMLRLINAPSIPKKEESNGKTFLVGHFIHQQSHSYSKCNVSNILYHKLSYKPHRPLLALQDPQQPPPWSPHRSGGTCSCRRELEEVQSSYLPVPSRMISSRRCEGEQQLGPLLPQVLIRRLQVQY